jgi:carbon storage regulator CsrA
MLVLSRRCGEKLIVGKDIVVEVVEVHGQRVRLGLFPPAGQAIDLRADPAETEAGGEVVPEVSFAGGRSQVLVWSRLSSGLRINETIQVRVVAADRDRVRLGIVAPAEVPIQRAEGEAATAPEGEQAGRTLQVTPEVLSDWVARKLRTYLKEQPRGALQKLAQAVGVSPVSIRRWRNRGSNLATEHLHALLPALGVGLDDLARELNVEQVLPPDIPTRGPGSRSEEGASARR